MLPVQETGNKANGTIVDVNGDFVLKVKSLNGKLTVSYVGITLWRNPWVIDLL